MSDALVFVAFQTGSQANGGLESLTYILRQLDARRIVVTQREGRFTDAWRACGCEVHVIDVPDPMPLSGLELARHRMRRGPAVARMNVTVARLVRQHGARVVHCNDPGAFWSAAPGATAAGARVVLNLRDTRVDHRYGFKWRLMRHLAGTIVVLSDEMRDEIDAGVPGVAPNLPKADVKAIYSAVDLTRLAPADAAERRRLRAKLGIGPEDSAVVYLGTFNDKKNQLGFIREAASAICSDGATKIFFVGDFEPERDEYAAQCRAEVERLRLDPQVRFVGFTDRPEDWYRAADVVCLASRNEGLARAMIEALACGTPVVSFDVSSAREILERHACGLVSPQGDYDALVGALDRVRRDPALRDRLGTTGALVARRLFAPTESVRRYVELYQSLGARVDVAMRSSSSA